jgi:hypothetical protein
MRKLKRPEHVKIHTLLSTIQQKFTLTNWLLYSFIRTREIDHKSVLFRGLVNNIKTTTYLLRSSNIVTGWNVDR